MNTFRDGGRLFGETLNPELGTQPEGNQNTLSYTSIHLLLSKAVMQQPPWHTGALPLITFLGHVLFKPKASDFADVYGPLSTPVENLSAHLKCYLSLDFLEPLHFSPNRAVTVLYLHLFDTVLIPQITTVI